MTEMIWYYSHPQSLNGSRVGIRYGKELTHVLTLSTLHIWDTVSIPFIME